ncbi:alpha/beta fold hydrolase [Curvivirga aplysinae]|uniref:alpha/beta fold hydrolase n=1 Tax=Curvivirga aplysinae TaxID=2529852 RepID=UPI0012BD2F5E|nr:alpha/beta hydrolase [Curvivirga aplysinae]MTI09698.1 alpha/beta hydrolase [Curvivirga aplysinae]
MTDHVAALFPNFEKKYVKVNGVDICYRIGGDGPPILLLHGFPQTHVMWHPIAAQLAKCYTVICADLRGYGDSSKPEGEADHKNYCKVEMAKDMIGLMSSLGYNEFQLIGHDRGGRVSHRLCLDYPSHVKKVVILDIIPTLTFFDSVTQHTAEAYYHWFFLTQKKPFPETLIGNSKTQFLEKTLHGLGSTQASFAKEAIAEYHRCFTDENIHAICEDYRAAATIDLIHDRADKDKRIQCPTLTLWGENGFMHKNYDFVAAWREKANIVTGHSIKAGHFLVEENPDATYDAIKGFLCEE